MLKLNQVIAIEKGTKSRVYSSISEIYKSVQKSELFNGFTRRWRKINEDVEDRPEEKKRVVLRAKEVIQNVLNQQTEYLDVAATKDFANCEARADVVVDGQTILSQVPVTFLLFLEKQLTDIRTFLNTVPTLSQDEEWKFDEALSLFRTDTASTLSTKKVEKPIVLFPATPEHPAQTQLITQDVPVGYWDSVKYSGALTDDEKKAYLVRVEKLLDAVKVAREASNSREVMKQEVGRSLFDYLLGNR